ncbi:oxidoreductase [Lithospermum erythrorhizon]|uniref:Oxidoreductase n=1 Tax=Lithospermum erythrorhizon TaxID=34254 RepID=A0AAV3QA77_LITER
MEVSKVDKNDGNLEIPQNPGFMMSLFNRSTTLQSPQTFGFSQKPFDRSGSGKNFYSSSYESMVSAGNSLKGKVKKLYSIFEKQPSHSSHSSQSLASPLSKPSVSDSAILVSSSPDGIYLPGTEDRVVVYFTSLRGVRRTFLDCSYVLMIFKAFRIELDERDISMHIAYKNELLNVLGEKSVTFPQVFIKGKHIGGVDLIRQLHESGELVKMLKDMPVKTIMKACDECGDFRFLPCINCDGSRKVFDEDEQQVRRCPDCNENGMVQCPICNVS